MMCATRNSERTTTASTFRQGSLRGLPQSGGAFASELTASLLVLHSGRGPALRERPCVVREFEAQETIVLTRRPKRSLFGVEMYLCRAPIGTTGDPATSAVVVRAGTWRCGPGRVEISNLPRTDRIANVEYTNAGIQVAAGERRGVVNVVDTAV